MCCEAVRALEFRIARLLQAVPCAAKRSFHLNSAWPWLPSGGPKRESKQQMFIIVNVYIGFGVETRFPRYQSRNPCGIGLIDNSDPASFLANAPCGSAHLQRGDADEFD